MKFTSILNDVIGPIMRGPSSSHTAGAYYIGKTISCFLTDRPVRIECIFDPDNSMGATYIQLGVDYAFAAGILKWNMLDNRYFKVFNFLKNEDIKIEYKLTRIIEDNHPNAMKIIIHFKDNDSIIIYARAIGGGGLLIQKINTWTVEIDGKQNKLLIRSDKKRVKEIIEILNKYKKVNYKIRESKSEKEILFEIGASVSILKLLIKDINKKCKDTKLWEIESVFYSKKGLRIFESIQDIINIAEEKKLSLGQISLIYEMELLGLEKKLIIKEMENRLSVMIKSVFDGFRNRNVKMKLSEPYAGTLMKSVKNNKVFLGNINTRAAIRAISAMHISNSMGVVCAAPTGGSAGVLPGVLVTLSEEYKLDKRTIIMAMFAAGGIGVLFLDLATFAAEKAGCQVEIGAAGAMAAAAIIEVAGGSAKKALDAAAISLQNTMGLVCDPVHGRCELPCQTRNGVAASNAFVCADIILAGYNNPIPLNETIVSSYETGRTLPYELRCTIKGGIAITPSALAIKELR